MEKTRVRLLTTWMRHPGDDTLGEGKGTQLDLTAKWANRLVNEGRAVITRKPKLDETATKRIRLLKTWMTRPGDDTLGEGKGQVLNMPKDMADRLIKEKKAVDLDAKPRRKRTTKKQVKEPPKNKAIQAAENK